MPSPQAPLILHPRTSPFALRLLMGLFALICLTTWLSPAPLSIKLAGTLLAMLLSLWEWRKLQHGDGIRQLILKADSDWELWYADGRRIEVPAAQTRADVFSDFIRLRFGSHLQLLLFPDSLAGDGFRQLKLRLLEQERQRN